MYRSFVGYNNDGKITGGVKVLQSKSNERAEAFEILARCFFYGFIHAVQGVHSDSASRVARVFFFFQHIGSSLSAPPHIQYRCRLGGLQLPASLIVLWL